MTCGQEGGEKTARNRWCQGDILSWKQREKQKYATMIGKGAMTDWTWEYNEEWNTAQQNVISLPVVWGSLLPFHWDCFHRWSSPTKTSAFPGFCGDTCRLWKPSFERKCQPQWFFSGIQMKALQDVSAYITSDQDCLLWTFLISVGIQMSKEKKCHCGSAIFHHSCFRRTYQPKNK